MGKQVTINLNYSGEKLWWSADGGMNWGIVGPQSPTTVLKPDDDVDWVADKTISKIKIDLKCDKVMDKVTGDSTNQRGKVKAGCENGTRSKYNIVFTPKGSLKSITVDPDMKVCTPEPCVPGTN